MSDTINTSPPLPAVRLLARLFSGGSALLVIVALFFVFLAITKEQFLVYSNIYSLVYALSIDAIAIAGFTYVMVTGEIDLSVGSVYALSGTLTGWMMNQAGLSMPMAISIGLCGALACGLVNGLLVTRLKVNSLMLTIGTLILIQGIAGVLVNDMVGATYARAFRFVARERWWGINTTVFYAFFGIAALLVFQARSTLFRKLYLVGEHSETARVYGINTDNIKLGAFVASALGAGIAGIFSASRLTHASIDMGVGLEFTYVTAAVIGGASLYGGRGGIFGSVIGLFFLAMIANAMVLYGINPLAQQVVIGVLLITAVFIDMVSKKRQKT